MFLRRVILHGRQRKADAFRVFSGGRAGREHPRDRIDQVVAGGHVCGDVIAPPLQVNGDRNGFGGFPHNVDGGGRLNGRQVDFIHRCGKRFFRRIIRHGRQRVADIYRVGNGGRIVRERPIDRLRQERAGSHVYDEVTALSLQVKHDRNLCRGVGGFPHDEDRDLFDYVVIVKSVLRRLQRFIRRIIRQGRQREADVCRARRGGRAGRERLVYGLIEVGTLRHCHGHVFPVSLHIKGNVDGNVLDPYRVAGDRFLNRSVADRLGLRAELCRRQFALYGRPGEGNQAPAVHDGRAGRERFIRGFPYVSAFFHLHGHVVAPASQIEGDGHHNGGLSFGDRQGNGIVGAVVVHPDDEGEGLIRRQLALEGKIIAGFVVVVFRIAHFRAGVAVRIR